MHPKTSYLVQASLLPWANANSSAHLVCDSLAQFYPAFALYVKARCGNSCILVDTTCR